MITQQLANLKLIHPPEWLPPNVMMEGIHGSRAYGCYTEESDYDLYGFCVPPKSIVFPNLAGEIPGFGRQLKRFEQFEQQHVQHPSGKEYGFNIYSIVRFFHLCMDNNPNMVDALFLPQDCITHSTHIWEMICERRKIFLHKGSYWRFTGYASQQLHKMATKNPKLGSKRLELREKYGYDTKFASHLVRLINECEQILTEGDLDLRRSADIMKDIRRGNWSEKQIRDWYMQREPMLKKLYAESKAVPYKPDEEKIKTLLLECMEHHYGSLEKCVLMPNRFENALREIKNIIDRTPMER